MSEPMYGQCPKCGGNLAYCFTHGCPRDPRKPIKLTKAARKVIRDAAKRAKEKRHDD